MNAMSVSFRQFFFSRSVSGKSVRALFAGVALLACSTWVRADLHDDLLLALNNGDTAQVQSYLQRGVDPNTVDPDGNTLLILAARAGNAALVDDLILRRARVSARNRHGDDALMSAAFQGHLPVVKLLRAAGAPMERPKGWTALSYAAFNGKLDVLNYLVAEGADVDAQSDNGTTALMVASRNGHEDVVKILLAARADPNHKNLNGASPMKWASAAGHSNIVDMLKRAGGVE